jgi:hypothetical protein
MLTVKQKADKLREAIALAQDVDNLIQAALGPSDVCYEYHNMLEELIDELTVDVQEFDNA